MSDSSHTWDQDAIGGWVRSFETPQTAVQMAAQANVAMARLLDWLSVDSSGLAYTVADDAAEVAVRLFGLASICGFNLLQAVDRRMETAHRRRTETGTDQAARWEVGR